MKILVLPSLLILLPIGILFFMLKLWPKPATLSTGLKIVLTVFFITTGLVTSVYAIGLSLNGMAEKHIRCATGVIIFIPYALCTYFIGVPLLLGLMKSSAIRGR